MNEEDGEGPGGQAEGGVILKSAADLDEAIHREEAAVSATVGGPLAQGLARMVLYAYHNHPSSAVGSLHDIPHSHHPDLLLSG